MAKLEANPNFNRRVKDFDVHQHARAQRGGQFLEVTRSTCSQCLQLVDAKILRVDNQIVLKKWCPSHGYESVLLHSDADWYLNSLKYNRPGELPHHFHSSVQKGCPHDCGLCPDHEQHSCAALVDLTNACNLNCPTCFADSKGKSFLTLEEIGQALDTYVEQEGVGTVVQYSGGEPTIHPQLIEAIQLALAKKIEVVMVNTNGLRLAQDEDFVQRLQAAAPEGLEIYLQFDGFSDEVYRNLRGRPLLDIKLKAIENCLKYDIPLNLVCVVKRGVNEQEVGKIVKYGIETRGIRGAFFQPVAYNGRYEQQDQMTRVTNSEVLELIEEQTRGMFRKSDFVPLPCAHPSLIAITYAYVKKGKVKPIPRFVKMDPYMDEFMNTINVDPSPMFKRALKGLWSAGSSFNSAKTLYDFKCVCGLPISKEILDLDRRRKFLNDHAFRIICNQFQDRYNWDMKSARKCCVSYALPSKKIIPFDTYNVIYRSSLERDN